MKPVAQVFSKTDEQINILFGIGLLALAVTELFISQHISQSARLFFYFGIMIFIGASGHIGFTLSLLLMLPEAKEWIRIKTKKQPWMFWTSALAIFWGTFIMGIVAFDFLSLTGLNVLTIAYIYLLMDWFFVIHHSIAQTHGLLIAYNRKLLKLGGTITTPRREAWNKRLSLIFLACAFATPLLYTLNIEASLLKVLNWSLFGLSAAALAVYGYFTFFPWYPERRNQGLYGLRLLLFPMMSISYFAGIGYRGVHSVEYIMVYKKLFQHSKKRVPAALVIAVSVFIFLFFTSIGFFSMAKDSEYLTALMKPSGTMAEWFKFLAAFNAACSFTHYYLDRIIFRMRDEDSRRQFGSLLSA